MGRWVQSYDSRSLKSIYWWSFSIGFFGGFIAILTCGSVKYHNKDKNNAKIVGTVVGVIAGMPFYGLVGAIITAIIEKHYIALFLVPIWIPLLSIGLPLLIYRRVVKKWIRKDEIYNAINLMFEMERLRDANLITEMQYLQCLEYLEPLLVDIERELDAQMNEEKEKEDFILFKGDTIFARTNAELLNQLLKKDYKAWMRSGYNLPDGKIIWMIELGPFITPAGWVNELVGDQIYERHVGTKFEYDTHSTYKDSLITGKKFCDADRVVFDIKQKTGDRKYIFRGVFRLNKEESTVDKNVWDLVKDEYFFG